MIDGYRLLLGIALLVVGICIGSAYQADKARGILCKHLLNTNATLKTYKEAGCR